MDAPYGHDVLGGVLAQGVLIDAGRGRLHAVVHALAAQQLDDLSQLGGGLRQLDLRGLAEAHCAEVQRLGLLAVHVVAVCLGELLDLALQALGGLDEDAAAGFGLGLRLVDLVLHRCLEVLHRALIVRDGRQRLIHVVPALQSGDCVFYAFSCHCVFLLDVKYATTSDSGLSRRG